MSFIPSVRGGRFLPAALAGPALAFVLLGHVVPASGAGIGTLAYAATDASVSSVEPGTTATSVACPAGHPVATGGGLEITGDESTLDLEVNTTLPSRGLKGWKGAANNSSGSVASMHVTVICAKGHITVNQVKKAVPSGTQGSLKVPCPRGSTLIGGGVAMAGATHLQEVATSAPYDGKDRDKKPDDGWAGRGNNGLPTAQKLTVAAICAQSGRYKYVHSAPAPVPDQTQVSNSVLCPSGTSVTGGGVSITGGTGGTEVGDTFPIDGSDADTIPDDGWSASANNDFTGVTQTMQVFAICKV